MKRSTFKTETGCRLQQGAAAIEFAFVLPVLLLMTYGMVVYGYTFILQQAITFAAQEAAEAAVRVDPSDPDIDYSNVIVQEVRTTAAEVLDFLPDNQKARVLGADNNNVAVTVELGKVTVVLTFNYTGLFAQLDLPFLGPVPPLPEVLTATGVVSI